MGQSPNSQNYTSNSEDYILVQGNADISNGWVKPRVWTTQVTKMANKGAIILSVRAPVGEVGKTQYPIVLGRGVAGIEGDEFVFQLLIKMKNDFVWRRLSTGSTFDSINSKDLKSIRIFTPKEPEKVLIGQYLEKLDQIVNLHQRKINTLKEQKKAYFRRVLVGKSENKPILRFKNFYGKWSNDKLENLFEYGGSGGTPKSTVKEYYEGNIPFLSISDISNSDGYINRTEKSISQKGLDNSAAWIVPKGAMSLAMYASVGKLAILNIEVATSQAFYNMVFKDDNLRDFVYQSLLKTNELNGWDSLVSTGTQRNLNANKVKNFTLSVPSNIHELIKVSKLLMNIDKVIDFHQSKLDNLIKLKTVYLNKMFI